MVDRESTVGELGVKLDGITDQLKDMRKEMFTQSLFNAWQNGYEARMARIENDQKDWARVSTQAHADLSGQITAKAVEAKAERDKLEVTLRAETSEVVAALELAKLEQKKIIERQEARRYDLVKAVGLSLLVAVLGIIGNMAVTLLKAG